MVGCGVADCSMVPGFQSPSLFLSVCLSVSLTLLYQFSVNLGTANHGRLWRSGLFHGSRVSFSISLSLSVCLSVSQSVSLTILVLHYFSVNLGTAHHGRMWRTGLFHGSRVSVSTSLSVPLFVCLSVCFYIH